MSDDQKALLRLLAQREEGYEDIAALMGLSVEEVRRRVREAMVAMDEGAGAAKDEGAPAAGPVAAGDPPPPPVAEASSGAVPPAAPPAEEAAASKPPRAPAPLVSRQAKPRAQSSMPRNRRRVVELVGGAVVVLLVILFATGAVDIGGDDDSESDSGAASDASSLVDDAAAKGSKLTQAILQPVDGGDAEGLAVFGRSKGAVLLLFQVKGLEPSGKGEAYAVSLSRSPTERIPIAVTRVPESGTVEAQYPVPSEALGLLANGFDQMEVSLVSNADLKAALTEAGKEQKAPDYPGEDVLRGDVTGPIVNVAAKNSD